MVDCSLSARCGTVAPYRHVTHASFMKLILHDWCFFSHEVYFALLNGLCPNYIFISHASSLFTKCLLQFPTKSGQSPFKSRTDLLFVDAGYSQEGPSIDHQQKAFHSIAGPHRNDWNDHLGIVNSKFISSPHSSVCVLCLLWVDQGNRLWYEWDKDEEIPLGWVSNVDPFLNSRSGYGAHDPNSHGKSQQPPTTPKRKPSLTDPAVHESVKLCLWTNELPTRCWKLWRIDP